MTPRVEPSDATSRQGTATLVVRNERAVRQTVVVTVRQDDTVLFEARETILAGRGARFEGAIPVTVGVPGDQETTIGVATAAGRELGSTGAVVTRRVRTVVATLLPAGVTWAFVAD